MKNSNTKVVITINVAGVETTKTLDMTWDPMALADYAHNRTLSAFDEVRAAVKAVSSSAGDLASDVLWGQFLTEVSKVQ
jgi:hypothetical protein